MKIFLCVLLGVLHSSYVFSNELEGRIIGTLATNSHFLELWLVQGESMYLVKDKEGKALTKAISKKELLARYPKLGEVVEGGIADDASLGPDIRRVPSLPEI